MSKEPIVTQLSQRSASPAYRHKYSGKEGGNRSISELDGLGVQATARHTKKGERPRPFGERELRQIGRYTKYSYRITATSYAGITERARFKRRDLALSHLPIGVEVKRNTVNMIPTHKHQ